MTRRPEPLDVECPVCGAGIGWPCRTFDSMDEGVIRNLAKRYCALPHAARVRAAQAYDESAFVQKAELLMGISQRIASVARG